MGEKESFIRAASRFGIRIVTPVLIAGLLTIFALYRLGYDWEYWKATAQTYVLAAIWNRQVTEGDTRRPLTEAEHRAHAGIGRVIGATGSGTGFLFGRGDLVVTNAHVVLDADGSLDEQLRFFPAGQSRISIAVRKVWLGTTDVDHERHNDWAILELATPVHRADRYLYRHLASPPEAGEFTPVVHVGLHGDKGRQKLISECHATVVAQSASSLLRHDCSAAKGASGSPLLRPAQDGEYELLGIDSATAAVGDDLAHIAVTASGELSKRIDLILAGGSQR